MTTTGEAEHLGSKAFLRHVSRYVQSQSHRFAAVVPPELAGICREELRAIGLEETEITEAGVEFEGRLDACYLANLNLRTASRILCRLPSFRAGTAEELFHKVAKIRWELWINHTVPLHVEAYVEHSRVEHEGTVADTVLAGIQRRFSSNRLLPPVRWQPPADEREEEAPPVPARQRVLAHLTRNHCTISLDATGAHLHERGYRLKHTGAPLRETLAAAILMKCGWKGDSPLIDGMCGAGTLAVEAASLARRLPPGLSRSFLFEKWPSFLDKTWAHLRRKQVEGALPESPVPIVAWDVDPDAVSVARENAERAGVRDDIRWETGDFFSFRPEDHGLRPGLVVLDPPYGKRLSGGGRDVYERIGTSLRQHFPGWQAAVLAPERPLATLLKLPSARFWNIKHGGMPIVVAMGRLQA